MQTYAAFGQTRITGTLCTIDLPEGFEQAGNYNFMSEELGALISVMEIPGNGYNSLLNDKREEPWNAIPEKVEHNGKQAVFARMNVDNQVILNYTFQVSPNRVVVVNGVYPGGAERVGIIIRRAMISVSYDANLPDDLFDDVDFLLDGPSAGLEPFKTEHGILYYRISDGPEKMLKVEVKEYSEEKNGRSGRDLVLENFYNLVSVDLIHVAGPEEISVAGFNGYQMWGEVSDTNENPCMLFLCIFRKDGKSYIFKGGANYDYPENLERIKGLVQTFRLKDRP